MNEKEKQEYLESYHQAKEKGVPFFPDILFKDAVVSLLVFLILIGLAYFVGAPLEARANPADTTYTPRPEWYFLFLFQLLKYFPGNLEVVGCGRHSHPGDLAAVPPAFSRSKRTAAHFSPQAGFGWDADWAGGGNRLIRSVCARSSSAGRSSPRRPDCRSLCQELRRLPWPFDNCGLRY